MATTSFILNRMLTSAMNIAIVSISQSESSPNWTASQKLNILGGFFWGYIASQIPSGILADLIGSKHMIGWSMFLSGILTISTPFLVPLGYSTMVASRVLLGFLLGILFATSVSLSTKWFSPISRGKLISCLEAAHFGTFLIYTTSGLLTSYLNWAYIFYILGGITLFWSLCWFYLVYESPKVHPRISEKEKTEIEEENLTQSPKFKFAEIPWTSIATNMPIWAVIIAQMSSSFSTTALQLQFPSYLDQVLHLDIIKVGLYSSAPELANYFTSLICGHLGDYLLKTQKISTLLLRNFSESIFSFIPVVCLSFLLFFGENVTIVLALFILIKSSAGFETSGHLANVLDIAPNFPGIVSAIVSISSALSAIASTKVASAVFKKEQTYLQWRYIFLISAVALLIGGVFFLTFFSVKVQAWNELRNNNSNRTQNDE